MTDLPTVRLLPKRDRRLRQGSPWVFANEIAMDAEAKALAGGSLVRIALPDGRGYGLAHFNPHSLIVARLLTRKMDASIDRSFIARRLERALGLRERTIGGRCYRLVHAEADHLPGLVIDRYGDVAVAQLNTAGMAAIQETIVAALEKTIQPASFVLRNDSPVRQLEGLTSSVEVVGEAIEPPIELIENGRKHHADPVSGQKTGWFFDQADNRLLAASIARDAEVLDLYSYTGGFAIAAALAGAKRVLAVDRAEAALELARLGAEANSVADRLTFQADEVFKTIDRLMEEKRRFGLVIADPPAFVRAKKDLASGLKGYRKLARGAAHLVAQDGFLAIGSCSHHVSETDLQASAHGGIRDAGRSARLLKSGGAAMDHPTHPALPETGYLKFLLYALD
ncbi:MAG: class I SAM-dependent rRNA methyltransferase [Geminicoccaceae bacterium]